MKISKGTIIRTILTLTVVLNIILKALGIHVVNIDEGSVACFIESAVEIGAVISAWWYNNSFTPEAKKADEFFKKLKEEN